MKTENNEFETLNVKRQLDPSDRLGSAPERRRSIATEQKYASSYFACEIKRLIYCHYQRVPTHEELARDSKLPSSSWGNWMRGVIPQARQVGPIAQFLGVQVETLGAVVEIAKREKVKVTCDWDEAAESIAIRAIDSVRKDEPEMTSDKCKKIQEAIRSALLTALSE